MKIGFVSGYFNPVHRGHLEYIHAAKQQVDYLVCIVNNDEQVKLKGAKPFMDALHRRFIMSNLRDVDCAWVAIDGDKTVCETLDALVDEYNFLFYDKEREYFFFNSGDRNKENLSSSETKICFELGIKEVVLNQQKVYSSSDLLKKVI